MGSGSRGGGVRPVAGRRSRAGGGPVAGRRSRGADVRRARRRTGALGVVWVGLILAVVTRLGRNAGATPSEVGAVLPGDGIAPQVRRVSTRAVPIAAPPAAVWPWLVQMGYRRGGWYAIDALERTLGVGDFVTGGSADRVVPELQDLAVGDRVPLSEYLHLVVAHLDAPRSLVLVLPGGPLVWVWSFNLFPVLPEDGGAEPVGTRLVVRTRMGARAGWTRALLWPLEVGHLVMEQVQLHRVRRRIETVGG